MKRKVASVFILVLLIAIAYCFLAYANEVMESVLFSFSIWKDNLVPTLFPFFVLSEFFIQYGLVDFLGELCKKFMNKIFHLPGECAFVLAMSMVSGFPSGAKYSKALLENKTITEQEATRLITFSHFSNPLFIMGTIATLFLKNKTLGTAILVCHFAANFVLGIIFRPKKRPPLLQSSSLRTALSKMHKKRMYNPLNFGQILTRALTNSFQTLFLMLGIVTFFLIITTLLQQIIPLNDIEKTLLSGILEMTQGVKYASTLSISLFFKSMLMLAFISFGGLSIHMQIISIICDTKIEYRTFFFARILHAIIACTLFLLCYPLLF